MLMEIEKENCICMFWLEYSEQEHSEKWHWLCIMPSL